MTICIACIHDVGQVGLWGGPKFELCYFILFFVFQEEFFVTLCINSKRIDKVREYYNEK